MPYISATERAELQAQITTKKAQLAALNTAYTAAVANSEVQSYTLDTAEGKQSATRRKPSEIRTEISALEREIRNLEQRFYGTGIGNMNLRRRSRVW